MARTIIPGTASFYQARGRRPVVSLGRLEDRGTSGCRGRAHRECTHKPGRRMRFMKHGQYRERLRAAACAPRWCVPSPADSNWEIGGHDGEDRKEEPHNALPTAPARGQRLDNNKLKEEWVLGRGSLQAALSPLTTASPRGLASRARADRRPHDFIPIHKNSGSLGLSGAAKSQNSMVAAARINFLHEILPKMESPPPPRLIFCAS
ncbi:hypothetical protein K438DRAFT_1936509 [Mycena galopus ATCC 62051]|nr:hypothetical protein K438DRAFT_1936509 [Mycena galopus ATCC 62051]